MKIVCLDSRTFETMLSKVEELSQRFRKLPNANKNTSLKRWMDGQDVCLFLRIQPRTLQTLRDNGTLAYTQIGRKIFYRPEDVRGIVKLGDNRKNEETFSKIKNL